MIYKSISKFIAISLLIPVFVQTLVWANPDIIQNIHTSGNTLQVYSNFCDPHNASAIAVIGQVIILRKAGDLDTRESPHVFEPDDDNKRVVFEFIKKYHEDGHLIIPIVVYKKGDIELKRPLGYYEVVVISDGETIFIREDTSFTASHSSSDSSLPNASNDEAITQPHGPSDNVRFLPIAEGLNSFVYKSIVSAIENRNKESIHEAVQKQLKAGARIIMVNVDDCKNKETLPETMAWVVKTIEDMHCGVTIGIGSSSTEVLKAGIEASHANIIVNALPFYRDRMDQLMPLIREKRITTVIMGAEEIDGSITSPDSPSGRIQVIDSLITEIKDKIPDFDTENNLIIDPCLGLLAPHTGDFHNTHFAGMRLELETSLNLREKYPEAGITMGIGNMSSGLPLRRMMNRVFLATAMACGVDRPLFNMRDMKMHGTYQAATIILDNWSEFEAKTANGGSITDDPDFLSRYIFKLDPSLRDNGRDLIINTFTPIAITKQAIKRNEADEHPVWHIESLYAEDYPKHHDAELDVMQRMTLSILGAADVNYYYSFRMEITSFVAGLNYKYRNHITITSEEAESAYDLLDDIVLVEDEKQILKKILKNYTPPEEAQISQDTPKDDVPTIKKYEPVPIPSGFINLKKIPAVFIMLFKILARTFHNTDKLPNDQWGHFVKTSIRQFMVDLANTKAFQNKKIKLQLDMDPKSLEGQINFINNPLAFRWGTFTARFRKALHFAGVAYDEENENIYIMGHNDENFISHLFNKNYTPAAFIDIANVDELDEEEREELKDVLAEYHTYSFGRVLLRALPEEPEDPTIRFIAKKLVTKKIKFNDSDPRKELLPVLSKYLHTKCSEKEGMLSLSYTPSDFDPFVRTFLAQCPAPDTPLGQRMLYDLAYMVHLVDFIYAAVIELVSDSETPHVRVRRSQGLKNLEFVSARAQKNYIDLETFVFSVIETHSDSFNFKFRFKAQPRIVAVNVTWTDIIADINGKIVPDLIATLKKAQSSTEKKARSDRQNPEKALGKSEETGQLPLSPAFQTDAEPKPATQREPFSIAGFVGNIANTRELSDMLKGAFESYITSGKILVIAVQAGLGGKDYDAEKFIKNIEKWKTNMVERHPEVGGLLKNLIVIHFQDTTDLARQLSKNTSIDTGNKKTNLIFTFAPGNADNAREISNLGEAIRPVMINEQGVFGNYYYYPLAEIVALSLTKQLLNVSIDTLLDGLSENGVVIDELNIANVKEDPNSLAYLIFTLIPKIEQYKTGELGSRSARLAQCLQSA